MKNDELENLMRSLKPAPLPADLKKRLSPEPMRPKPAATQWKLLLVSAAVVAVGLFSVFIMNLMDSPQEAPSSTANTPMPIAETPVSVLKTDSTLLNSRTLEIKEVEGRLWEISEEEWRDDTLALCSAGPVKLNSTVIRREIVCSPLEFH